MVSGTGFRAQLVLKEVQTTVRMCAPSPFGTPTLVPEAGAVEESRNPGGIPKASSSY